MMAGWDRQPTLVLGRCLDILTGNAPGHALFDAVADRNLVRPVFLSPAGRDVHPDRDRVAADTVAALRSAAGADPDDPRPTALVGEPSLKSREFARAGGHATSCAARPGRSSGATTHWWANRH
jgi:transcription regulator MmyB-like protein